MTEPHIIPRIFDSKLDNFRPVTQQDIAILDGYVQKLAHKNPALATEIHKELKAEGVIPSG